MIKEIFTIIKCKEWEILWKYTPTWRISFYKLKEKETLENDKELLSPNNQITKEQLKQLSSILIEKKIIKLDELEKVFLEELQKIKNLNESTSEYTKEEQEIISLTESLEEFNTFDLDNLEDKSNLTSTFHKVKLIDHFLQTNNYIKWQKFSTDWKYTYDTWIKDLKVLERIKSEIISLLRNNSDISSIFEVLSWRESIIKVNLLSKIKEDTSLDDNYFNLLKKFLDGLNEILNPIIQEIDNILQKCNLDEILVLGETIHKEYNKLDQKFFRWLSNEPISYLKDIWYRKDLLVENLISQLYLKELNNRVQTKDNLIDITTSQKLRVLCQLFVDTPFDEIVTNLIKDKTKNIFMKLFKSEKRDSHFLLHSFANNFKIVSTPSQFPERNWWICLGYNYSIQFTDSKSMRYGMWLSYTLWYEQFLFTSEKYKRDEFKKYILEKLRWSAKVDTLEETISLYKEQVSKSLLTMIEEFKELEKGIGKFNSIEDFVKELSKELQNDLDRGWLNFVKDLLVETHVLYKENWKYIVNI